MPLVYITSLYSVRDAYLPTLYHHFQQLLPHLSAPVLVFTDRTLPFSLPPTCTVLSKSLDAFETYKACMNASARLPQRRNIEKDTVEFMALMNTKVEMVREALSHLPAGTTHVAWIDAGIAKIMKKPVQEWTQILGKHATAAWPVQSVTLPGCWVSVAPPSSDTICWRFCGGFCVIPTHLVDPFYRAVRAVLEKWLTAGHLAWEVNIWAALEWEEAAWFTWWGADHNDTMLEVPGFLG
jgi:hypothetical protein